MQPSEPSNHNTEGKHLHQSGGRRKKGLNCPSSCLNPQHPYGCRIPSPTPAAPLTCLLLLLTTSPTCLRLGDFKNNSKLPPVVATPRSSPGVDNFILQGGLGVGGRCKGSGKGKLLSESNSDVLHSVCSEGKLTAHSCGAASMGMRPRRAPAYFPWPEHKPLTSFQTSPFIHCCWELVWLCEAVFQSPGKV